MTKNREARRTTTSSYETSRANTQGVLAGVPFFDEVFKYCGCT